MNTLNPFSALPQDKFELLCSLKSRISETEKEWKHLGFSDLHESNIASMVLHDFEVSRLMLKLERAKDEYNKALKDAVRGNYNGQLLPPIDRTIS